MSRFDSDRTAGRWQENRWQPWGRFLVTDGFWCLAPAPERCWEVAWLAKSWGRVRDQPSPGSRLAPDFDFQVGLG